MDRVEGSAATTAASPPTEGLLSPPPATHGRLAQRLYRRYGAQLELLPAGWPDAAHMRAAMEALRAGGEECGAALRILRQLVMLRIMELDCNASDAPGAQRLACVTQSVTTLAEVALDVACTQALAELEERFGAPLKADGSRCRFWIVGMGKLGARELNVSSDIDLICLYESDGQSAGKPGAGGKSISLHEYFTRAVRRIHALVGEPTEHGFVFRVDLALRPNGNSGPVVSSLDALDEYLQVQGREWERFAWLKGRVVAPQAAIADGSAQMLRGVVQPFVFRKYLDYNVFESLRVLHCQIRDYANSRSALHPERANDIKLGRGGIREIEFTVQLLQVVRGGQYPELRTRPTLRALQRVAQAGLMSAYTAAALQNAYIFLRHVEHRIQYLDDEQSHVLPSHAQDLAWIARTMHCADEADFICQLQAHRELVQREFDTLLGAPQHRTSEADAEADAAQSGDDIAALCALAAPWGELAQRLERWREHPRVQGLRIRPRARLMRLMQRSLQWLSSAEASTQGISAEGVLRFVDWAQTLLRREVYLTLLLERPAIHARLLRLLGAARWGARYLIAHPAVIDELSSGRLFDERFNAAAFCDDLQRRRAALRMGGEDDEEALLNLLRRALHAETFRTLARDLEGHLSVEQVADDLSSLADAVLGVAARWCWEGFLPRARRMGWTGADGQDLGEHLAIIAYGKLGALELGYGSDLDLVFIHADHGAADIHAAFVRRLIAWLTVKTGEGELYEIDTALRPNGNSGLLCTSMAAYEDYQLQRGSNTAWVWEHQAMTRARCCLGSDALRARFEAVRSAVLCAQRDADALRRDIVSMRARIAQAHPHPADAIDIKHGAGAMLDAEFATQYLVLLHSRTHPAMLENRGNIALLERADTLGLLPAPTGHAAAAAYRELRRLQHRARLDEAPALFPPQTLQTHTRAIEALWRATLKDGS